MRMLSEIQELRMAVRSMNQLIDKQRRLIHTLTTINDEPCEDDECPICLEAKDRLKLVKGDENEN